MCCKVAGLVVCCWAVTVMAHPSHVISGMSFSQGGSLSWLKATLNKNGIKYFTNQDMSQDPSVGNAMRVHRRPESWTRNQKVLRKAGVLVLFSGAFWPLSLLHYGFLPQSTYHLAFPYHYFPSTSHLAATSCIWLKMAAPKWPPQPQSEINRDLTNILESLFSFSGVKTDGFTLAQGT